MPHGKLTVIVESATTKGTRDSYCTLQCGSQVLSTEVAEGGGSDLVFHTEFEFEIDSSTNELAISVYSIKGTVEDDKLVGHVVLNFKQVFYHGHTVPLTAYPLSRSSGKAGGFIIISLEFKSRPSPQTAHVPVRQYSAPPHAAPQQNPGRQFYPNGTEAYEDGYGSSGSEGSRSSRRSSKESRESVGYRRSQSEQLPRPSPLAAPSRPSLWPRPPVIQGGPHVAIFSRPREPIQCRPQLNFANPHPQQLPPRMANRQVQVYQDYRPQPPVWPQQPGHVQHGQQVVMHPHHHPHHHHHPHPHHGVGADIAKAVAVQATKSVLNELFHEVFQQ